MSDLFLCDKNYLSYDDLLNYINDENDLDLSVIEEHIFNTLKNIVDEKCDDVDDLIDKILNSKKTITFSTSGTTGKLKKIKQKVKHLIRNVKIDNNHRNDIWGLTYNPEKIASYHVLFQAILNKNKIIVLWDKEKKVIEDKLKEITHISATPTFYSLLINNEIVYPNIKQITVGGEISNNILFEKIKKIFPNSKLTNVYASTECGSLLSTHGEYFKIPEKYINLIKIDNSELLIHKSLTGNLNKKKYDNDWYRTGDIVEYINETEFKIVNRKSDIINVGGFKVNPIKIENIVNKFDYVILSKVYGRKNSILGSIVCMDVVLKYEVSIEKIKKDLLMKINKYELPLKIYIVNNIETLNNKIVRN
jgi:acyl-coenzyme A synthetase/AMP-(fatty) acid ligase